MSTANDNKANREATEAWSVSLEYSQGVSANNSVDPNGAFPRSPHWGNSSINYSARGLKINDLWGIGSSLFVNTDYKETSPSVFPFNQINETPSGHIVEYDDTPGNERILIRHRSGSGVDLRPDGSVIVSTKRNRVSYVAADETLIIDGDANLEYNGNVNMNVAGDFDLNVGGEYCLSVAGESKEKVVGSKIVSVDGNHNQTIRGSSIEKTMEVKSDIVVGNRYDVIDGTWDLLVDDKAEMKFSKDLRVSSMENVNIASDKFETVSNEVGILAPEGTIGGENTEHYGRLFTGPSNAGGSGTSFVGSLVGIAAEAITSRYAIYAEEAYFGGITKYAIVATNLSNVPEPWRGELTSKPDYKMELVDRYTEERANNVMPTSDIVTGILETTDKGIIQFRVEGEDIKNQINREDEYQGSFKSDPNIDRAIQEMQASSVRTSDVPKNLYARNIIEDWRNTVPNSVSKKVDREATPITAEEPLGNEPIKNSAFKVKKDE